MPNLIHPFSPDCSRPLQAHLWWLTRQWAKTVYYVCGRACILGLTGSNNQIYLNTLSQDQIGSEFTHTHTRYLSGSNCETVVVTMALGVIARIVGRERAATQTAVCVALWRCLKRLKFHFIFVLSHHDFTICLLAPYRMASGFVGHQWEKVWKIPPCLGKVRVCVFFLDMFDESLTREENRKLKRQERNPVRSHSHQKSASAKGTYTGKKGGNHNKERLVRHLAVLSRKKVHNCCDPQ